MQGVRQNQQQIVIQTQQGQQQQVQISQSPAPQAPSHQIVIQKQGVQQNIPTTISQVAASLPPQIQVQTKTVLVKQQPHGGTTIVNEEKLEVTQNCVSSSSVSSSDGSETVTNGTSSPVSSLSQTPSMSQSPVNTNNSSSSGSSVVNSTSGNAGTTNTTTPGQPLIQMIPAMDPNKIVEEEVDPSWLWICDWRGCPKYVYVLFKLK